MDPVPFASVDASALRWLPAGEPPLAWELRAGPALLLRIEWATDRGSLATARAADVAWTFKRAGFLSPSIVARTAGTPTRVGVLTAHVASHAIQLAGGATYRLRRAGLALPAWSISTDTGAEIAHLELAAEGRTLAGGAVVVPASETRRPELPFLLAISWYFVVTAWAEERAVERLVELEQRVGSPGSEASVARN